MQCTSRSRKWILAAFSTCIASLALFTGHLEGSEWITSQSLIFALYGASNVAQKKLMKENP